QGDGKVSAWGFQAGKPHSGRSDELASLEDPDPLDPGWRERFVPDREVVEEMLVGGHGETMVQEIQEGIPCRRADMMGLIHGPTLYYSDRFTTWIVLRSRLFPDEVAVERRAAHGPVQAVVVQELMEVIVVDAVKKKLVRIR